MMSKQISRVKDKPENRLKQTRPGKRKAPRSAWKKGQSGNPGGRPKEVAEVRELSRQYTEEAIQTLVTLMQSAKVERTRLAAASELLDRGYGRPPQAVDLGGPIQIVNYDSERLSTLSNDEIRALDTITRKLTDPGSD